MSAKLIFLCLIFSLPVYGQNESALKDPAVPNNKEDKSHKFSIGGSIGCGIPEEGYKLTAEQRTKTGYIQPGYADPGTHFSVNVNYRASKNVGLILESESTINPLSKKYYDELLESGNGGTYYAGGILLGPYFSKTFKNGNELEGRFLIGLMILNKSAISINQPVSNTHPGFSNDGFGAESGVKFKFHITKGVYFTIDATYTQSITNDMYVNLEDWWPATIPEGPLGIFSAGFGAEYKF